ncbi:hypothetical protein GJ744_002470 [Endocarpon pusillum]|uniref:DUF924-domain-containing protein n=1 Tax=Endocarpon pusillum TaxID=364733 RepID=A0A8H7E2M8_9EURO|nr:hypothetical protein GJ744_002470 [Endocarpon pusillum]
MPSLRTFSLDARLFNPTLYQNLLKLWFDGLPEGATGPTEQLAMRWFGLGATESDKASFDRECHSRFHEALSSISPAIFVLPVFKDADADRSNYPEIAAPFIGQLYQNKIEDPESALGLTLLLDQIPRNIFRSDQALIFGHYDRIARAVFYAIYKQQLDKHERYAMSALHRTWFYMPLMHSESLADHQLLSQEMGNLKSGLEAKGDEKAAQHVGQTLSFEKRHVDILDKFGRYPHRNKWLGRKMTDEERNWLDQGGDTFTA